MFPYYYQPSASDSDYLRALAEERAAREQYIAARRAQEEARQRAARARAARNAYISPYSSYHDDLNDFDLDMDLDDGAYHPRQRPLSYMNGERPYGYGLGPYAHPQRTFLEEQRRRELLEEQRRRELMELERERERRRLEEERIRRILQEERQKEELARQKLIEEERRRAVEEDRLRRAAAEDVRRGRGPQVRSSQQAALDPLLRALGLVPETSELEQEVPRARPYGARRAAAPSPSPIRPFPFGRTSSKSTQQPADSTPTAKMSSSPPATTIPISSPEAPAQPTPTPSPSTPQPSAEQVAAAEKIQEAFRARSARKQALKAVSTLRKRFLAARNGFTLPLTLDYDITTNGRIPTAVTVDPAAALPSPSEELGEPLDDVPRLAYSSRNAPLHAYEEELNRILSALDAVESRGDLGVRAARRELARTVEREAERVERWRGVVWHWWKQQETANEESSTSSAAPVPVPVSSEKVEMEAAQEAGPEPALMEVEVPAPSTSESAPMDVEPEPIPAPSSVAEATESTSPSLPLSPLPASEDTSSSHTAPQPEVAMVVEEPSAAEGPCEEAESPVDPSSSVVDSSSPAPIESIQSSQPPSDAQHVDLDQEPDFERAPTPALSHGPESESDVEVEMEVEDTHTSPPDGEREHSPAVVAVTDASSMDSDAESEATVAAPEVVVPKSERLSLVNEQWDAFAEYDMF